MAFADQAELFPVVRSAGCLRHELGNCLAPCASACTRRDYRGNVRALLDFLAGKDRQPIDMLTREMNEAAVAQQYERAAALRDQLDRLVWMDQMLERARTAAVQSFVYPVRNPVGGELWYLIERGRVRRVLPRPNDDAQRQLALKVLGEVYRASDHPDPLTIEEMDSVLLVAGWFRKFPAERERSLSPTVARALLTQEPEA
jgi:excinuclease ABC subunit C